MKLYHLSGRPDIKRFWPFTHFGTRTAALAIANSNFRTFGSTFLYECEVVGNPVITPFVDHGQKILGFLNYFRKLELPFPGLTDAQRKREIDRIIQETDHRLDIHAPRAFDEYGIRVYREVRDYVSQELIRHGYQAFSYENEIEDVGQASYVFIDTKFIEIRHIEKVR